MQTQSNPLPLSCPHCGGPSLVRSQFVGPRIAYQNGVKTYITNDNWYIQCDDCGAKSGIWLSEAEAIAAWNKRTDDTILAWWNNVLAQSGETGEALVTLRAELTHLHELERALWDIWGHLDPANPPELNCLSADEVTTIGRLLEPPKESGQDKESPKKRVLFVCQKCGEEFSEGEDDHGCHPYCGGQGDPIGYVDDKEASDE